MKDGVTFSGDDFLQTGCTMLGAPALLAGGINEINDSILHGPREIIALPLRVCSIGATAGCCHACDAAKFEATTRKTKPSSPRVRWARSAHRMVAKKTAWGASEYRPICIIIIIISGNVSSDPQIFFPKGSHSKPSSAHPFAPQNHHAGACVKTKI